MKLDRMDLNLLLAFEALCQTKSVSKAATRLGIRQPAMSAALGRLRTLMGDALFVRVAGAMQPTPKALRLAQGIEPALAQLRATLGDGAAFAPRDAKRTFTLASTDYTTCVLGPALYADVAMAAPGIDLRILGYDKDNIPELLDRGDIDLALGVFSPPPERVVRRLLCPERFVGLARRGHPALAAGEMSLATYAGLRHALVSVQRDARGEIDKALAAQGLSRRIALTLPHMLALPDLLACSDLVAALPRRMAMRAAGKALTVFELPLNLPEWRIEMLWNPATRTDPASMWLRARVLKAAGGLS
jgi:DNA-binding transcriptional LysR family regulator